MNYALIKDDTVHNVIVADDGFIATIAYDWDHIERIDAEPGVGIGWGWAAGAFTAPQALETGPSEPIFPVLRHLSIGSFFDRFGAAKWAILADQAPTVQAVIKDASVRTYIDLDHPQLPQALALLTAAGHDFDAHAVVDAPVQPEERP